MDTLGQRLATYAGLKVYDFPPKSAQAPFAFVSLPEGIDYDLTYGRGSDRCTLDVYVGIGTQLDRQARDRISLYAAADDGIKEALETAAPGEVAAFQSVRVRRVEFRTISLATVDYVGAVFTLDLVL